MTMYDANGQAYERHINWGGVVKGAAIVVGVALAAAVGIWAVSGIAAYLTGAVTANAGASALAAGAHTGLAWAANEVGLGIHALGLGLAAIPGGLAHILGLTGQHFAQAAAVNHAAGIMGGAAAGVLATHAALPHLHNTQFTTVDPVNTIDPSAHDASMLTAAGVAPVLPLHDISHISHHAAEHADEQASENWTRKFAPRSAYGSYANNVLAQKEERKAPAPSASFTEQLNADRANLDAALAK